MALHLPIVVASRFQVAALLGAAESAAMAAGLAMLALPPETRRHRRVLVAASEPAPWVFGVSHFASTRSAAASESSRP